MSTTHDQTSIQLKSGVTIPLLGLGTWLSKPGEVGNAVDIAIRSAGYRHIDCAQAYQNQSEIGVVFNRLIHDEHIIKVE
jgi:diketogulonate reductase-like aldo/keto reductase